MDHSNIFQCLSLYVLGVACRNLGFDAGLVLCCSVYGTLTDTPIMTNIQCGGHEQTFTDCHHDNVVMSEVSACQVNYAAVACYNGSKTSGSSLSVIVSFILVLPLMFKTNLI